MLTAVFLPREATLAGALKTPVAQQAIDAGFGLYTNGIDVMLLPQGRPGWFPIAVTVRDLLPIDLNEVPSCAA